MLALLDFFECGGLVRSRAGLFVAANRVAIELLTSLRVFGNGSSPRSVDALVRETIPVLVRNGGAERLLLPRPSGTPLMIARLPIPLPRERTIYMIVDIERARQPSVASLRDLFHLTPAESTLAIALARGLKPMESADHAVRATTVRTHLDAVLAKTDTHRQAQLVAVLNSVARLP